MSEPGAGDSPSEGGVAGTAFQLRYRLRQQEILAEIGALGLRGGELDLLFQEATRLIALAMETRFCKIMEYLPEEDQFLVRAGVGWREGLVGQATTGADLASPTGYAFQTGESVISDHQAAESRFRTPELLIEHGIRRAINVPIRSDDSAFGVLEADSPHPDDFEVRDLAFMQAASNLLGVAIGRKRAEAALTAARARTDEILESISDAFYAVDHEWRFTYVNHKAEEWWGRPREALLGQVCWEEFPQAVGGEAYEAHMRAARERRVVHLELMSPVLRHWVGVSIYPTANGGITAYFRDISERKAAEQQLARLQERLDLALSASRIVGIWDWDLRSGLVHADANFARIYNVDPEAAAAGVPLAEYTRNFHPDDAPAFRAALDRVFAGADEFSSEYRVLQPDGSTLWVLARGRLVRDSEGKPVRFPGTSVEITALRQAELRQAALLELGDRLRDLQDPAEMAFVAAEIMGRVLGVSGAGYGTIEDDGATLVIERDWTAPGIASLAGRHRMWDYGFYIRNLRCGETVIITDAAEDPRTASAAPALQAAEVRALINLPLIEQGKLVALFFVISAEPRLWTAEEAGFLRDVAERVRSAAERRRAESALQEMNATLEQRVEERTRDRDRVWRNSRDLLVIIGADGIFRAINPAWTAILGHDPAEVIGRSFLDFVWPEDTELTQSGLDNAASSRHLTGFENRYRHKDGTPRWISWHSSVEGDLVYAYGRDITAVKEQARALAQAEEALRQSQKMEAVGQLTGGLAHDFNNLLTGITGSLELLKARMADGRLANVDRYISAAQGAASRAAALTHRLLAFSRRQTLDPKRTDANRLIAGMEELIRRTVGPEIAVRTVLAEDLWPTLCDPNQLENALLNLCINARDAMPDGGQLTIETANFRLDARTARERDMAADEYVVICVTDTGTGMSPETASRAFDPFFTTKPLGQGTGLGLSMIYGFAKQSGGQARIYSEIGQGTTMRLYLPRHRGDEAAEEQAPSASGQGMRAGVGETVLIVDDEPTVRMLVTEVLEDLGYAAIEAADAASGLKVLQSNARIDLLVTDVGLPGGMNGRQMADAARQGRPELKVLFITGYAENAVLEGHLEPGMHVLTKPFAMEALASRIRDLITGQDKRR